MMYCRVKTLCGLVVLMMSFYLEMTHAGEISWALLSSSKVEIQTYSSAQGEVISSYPPFIHSIMTGLWSWDPHDDSETPPKNSSVQNSTRDPGSNFSELMKNLSIKFDVSDPEHFRKVWFHLTPTLKVRGLFGVHDFKHKRPLVILRMGIHGNVDEFLAERFLAKAVYEDLDANFLVLESLTSHAFLSQNNTVSFGGIDEGLQTFLILNYLTDNKSDLKNFIGKIHLMGVSLGGHGTFVTALLDQNYGHQLASVINFCPLINLQQTFEYHVKKGFRQGLIDLWNVRRMSALFDIYPEDISNSKWWDTMIDFKPRFTPMVLRILNHDRTNPLVTVEEIQKQLPKMKWPYGFDKFLKKKQSFFEMNDFWRYYIGVTTPMKIYTTPNDPLVINSLNSDLIFSGEQIGNFRSLKYEKLDRGVHCGLASVYKWGYVVNLVRQGMAGK